MLGLSDPAVYGLIGTFLKTWTPHAERALRFYEKARLLEPAHPMHAFNKALVLADLGRIQESAVALNEAIRKGSNRPNWFKANQSEVEKLRLRL
jgi:predicted Zn-dependent protease